MKVTLFGTAAAEGFPAMFCECDTCQRARKSGGRNLRTRSQALIDESVLIDFGPDTLSHTLFGGLNLIPVTDLLITHSHCDHLHRSDFENRKKGYCTIQNKVPLRVFGTSPSIDTISELCQKNSEIQDAVELHPVVAFQPYTVGQYTVIPLKADHDAKTDPVIYLISDSEKNFLYATDTGIFPQETMAFLKNWAGHIDAMAIDCTAILLKNWRRSHMGLDTDLEQITALREIGVIDQTTQIILHHFSHNGGATYDELVPIAAAHDLAVAYDNMVIEV